MPEAILSIRDALQSAVRIGPTKVSLFGSYSKSFAGSNTAIVYGQSPIDAPQKARQYETGIKGSFFDGKVYTSATVFRLFQYNIAESDPAHPGYSNLIGQARSEGIEYDITGRVTRNLSVVANYTYDDASVVAANGISRVNGRRLAQVPRHVGNVWARYDTAPGSSRGWMFGLGEYISGDFFAATSSAHGRSSGLPRSTIRIPCHIPEKSGLPPAVRGVGPLGASCGSIVTS